jgi:hypothetical protein
LSKGLFAFGGHCLPDGRLELVGCLPKLTIVAQISEDLVVFVFTKERFETPCGVNKFQ